MEIIHFASANLVLKAPSDWDEEANGPCHDLPVLVKDGMMFSVWKPSAEELAVLNEGGAFVMGLRVAAHPVVSLSVTHLEPLTEGEVVTLPAYQEDEEVEESSEIVPSVSEVVEVNNGATALTAEEEHDTIQEAAERNTQNKLQG